MERLTYRDSDGRALLTNKGMKTYCSTQATADVLCRYEEIIDADKPEFVRCKDCEHNIGGRCDNLDLWVGIDPEWFCADGRKKGTK